MTSRFSGNFSDVTIPGGDPLRPISGDPTTVLQQQRTMSLTNQNTPPSKRSFSDFQSFQQQQPYLLMRSLKQKTTNSFVYSSTSTQFGSPVYQQQQQTVSFLNNNNNNNNNYCHGFNALDNNLNNVGINNSTSTNLFGPGLNQTQYHDTPNPVQPYPKLETSIILSSLEELEKELLKDDDDDENNGVSESDPLSEITNSEWSETFRDLIEPPNLVHNESHNNHGTTGNSMISSSPTSSTSSCSTSASQTASPPSITQLITEATLAISDGKLDLATEILAQLFKTVNQTGSSEQRAGFYMAHALQSRVGPTQNPTLDAGEGQMSEYLLYEMSPCFKFGLLTANVVLLDAVRFGIQEKKKIHLIGFHVGYGCGQYLNLLRALGDRRYHLRAPLKITMVKTEVGNGNGNGDNECGEGGKVGNSLMVLAEKMGVDLEFVIITRKITELTRDSLSCKEGELVLVNLPFWVYRVPDESVSVVNLRDELLRRVKSFSPRVVTLAEQDMNANTSPFVTRVNESWSYYGALFDSLELTRDNPDRVRVEELLGRKMANAVACEGEERVERNEVFGKWRARMGMAGFELKPLSQSIAESIRVKLDSVRGGKHGFTVEEVNGGLCFGWKGKTIAFASAWC